MGSYREPQSNAEGRPRGTHESQLDVGTTNFDGISTVVLPVGFNFREIDEQDNVAFPGSIDRTANKQTSIRAPNSPSTLARPMKRSVCIHQRILSARL